MRPYSLYVRFLATKGIESSEEANQFLDEFDLAPISDSEWDEVYTFVHKTVPEGISNQILNKRYEGEEFLRFMKVLDVQELWKMEKKFSTPETLKNRLIYDIKNDPIMRIAINALIVKGCKIPDIVQDINLKFSYMLKEEHVRLYKKFFTNPELMTRKDWKAYLKDLSGQDRAIYFLALTEDLAAVKVALDLPTNIDISGSLQTLLVSTYQKAKFYLNINSEDANKEARAWIATMLTVAEKHQKYSKADIGDFAKTIQMEFDYVNNDFDTPDEEILKELAAKNLAARDQVEEDTTKNV